MSAGPWKNSKWQPLREEVCAMEPNDVLQWKWGEDKEATIRTVVQRLTKANQYKTRIISGLDRLFIIRIS